MSFESKEQWRLWRSFLNQEARYFFVNDHLASFIDELYSPWLGGKLLGDYQQASAFAQEKSATKPVAALETNSKRERAANC